jgi:predicted phage-related endonuclease
MSENNNERKNKATLSVVTKIEELATLRAEITRLTKLKDELATEIDEAFGESDILIHRNIEVARRDWRERAGVDTKKLEELFPEAANACKKITRYSVIVALYKDSKVARNK